MTSQPIEITTLESLFTTRTRRAMDRFLDLAPTYCGLRLDIIQTESGSELLGCADVLRTLSGRAGAVASISLPETHQDDLAQLVGCLFIHETGLEKIIAEITEDMPEIDTLGDRLQLWIFPEGAILAPVGPERLLSSDIPQQDWAHQFHIIVEASTSKHSQIAAHRQAQALCARLQCDVLGLADSPKATLRPFIPAYHSP